MCGRLKRTPTGPAPSSCTSNGQESNLGDALGATGSPANSHDTLPKHGASMAWAVEGRGEAPAPGGGGAPGSPQGAPPVGKAGHVPCSEWEN